MTAQQLREKLVRAFATELALDTDGAHDFANVLIAIICSQREALEEYSRKRPAKMGGPGQKSYDNEQYQKPARKALAATDAKLKAMGVLP
jgi:hypothetical protein